ncbi:MAG: ATP-binding protein [Bradymonadia bacterium]
MRRSFVRLVVLSVLGCWTLSFVLMLGYSRTLSWLEDRAQTDGVFLALELVEAQPVARRAERVASLQPHYEAPLSLMNLDEVRRHISKPVHPGEHIPHRVDFDEEWYFFAFKDGSGALAVGPMDPTNPKGFLPIGLFIAAIALPLLAGLLALRVERAIQKVERASEALATGDLNARVHSEGGPSRELAAKFNAMAERIERLVRSRDELVQAVSHELGSPLSRLRFHLALLEDDADLPQQQRLDAMTRELDALDALVAELLSYVQSDELTLESSTFDPHRSLTDLAELATLDAPEAQSPTLTVELPEGTSICADPRLFQRAVENLLRNAMQHAAGRVLLQLTQDDDHVRVAIHDDGPGIPETQREKVLVPFFRLQADRSRETGGVGLGLAIVSRIMQRHGGAVEIGQSPLGGAELTTLWPRIR